ncbi:WD40-repeat-containing domain protein [Tricharina praecox]|uniref:WD40-repeat-containing domain protein n=1 Tax=Tricharina praecox TaxID=43433 RepID=UPI002220DDA1|nr:WD40-repeat-containing domain protein [Tricharina praecox]KAI5849978.1 WD40-repeat-containing domain protein [Tricharina praecox]
MEIDQPEPRAQSQVQVKFVTRDTEISVPTAPILVPSNLKRLGLSQVVNHLLASSQSIPFDFLVDGAYLRSTIDAYILENGLSSESVLTLEYVRAAVPPKFLTSFQHDDWVSSVAASTATNKQRAPVVLTGSYDGIARVWNTSGAVLCEAAGHQAAIKAVKWVDGDSFVTAGMDRALRVWRYTADSTVEAGVKAVAEYVGHKATVEALAVDAATKRILSACADGNVGVWSSVPKESPAAPEVELPARTKKRRLAQTGPRVAHYGALQMLQGHTAPVSGVAFAPQDSSVAYSVSWDHTIKTWDLTTMVTIDTKTTQHPILSLCAMKSLNILACGSSARHIILHDPRESAQGVSAATLRGHSNAVVGLSANPENEWQLASAGHDGTVRVWDVRASSSGNLFTINREGEGLSGNEKVFDVEWSSVGIVSGGEDKRVQINATPRGQDVTVNKP